MDKTENMFDSRMPAEEYIAWKQKYRETQTQDKKKNNKEGEKVEKLVNLNQREASKNASLPFNHPCFPRSCYQQVPDIFWKILTKICLQQMHWPNNIYRLIWHFTCLYTSNDSRLIFLAGGERVERWKSLTPHHALPLKRIPLATFLLSTTDSSTTPAFHSLLRWTFGLM